MNNICVDRTIELKDNSKDESFVIALNNIYININILLFEDRKRIYVK